MKNVELGRPYLFVEIKSEILCEKKLHDREGRLDLPPKFVQLRPEAWARARGQALTTMTIRSRQDPKGTPVKQVVRHTVPSPAVSGTLDLRTASTIAARPPASRRLGADAQAFFFVQTIAPLGVDRPALPPKQHRQATIPVPDQLLGRRPEVRGPIQTRTITGKMQYLLASSTGMLENALPVLKGRGITFEERAKDRQCENVAKLLDPKRSNP